VVLRYEPRDITTILVYRREHDREVFLAKAHAQNLETEQLSIEEIRASNQKLREKGKAISNRTILEEVRDRDIFVAQKKSKKERQKAEQADLYSVTKQSQSVEPVEEVVESVSATVDVERVEILNYDELRDDYGW
jgi:putative transposase